jgi:hypothetical protein
MQLTEQVGAGVVSVFWGALWLRFRREALARYLKLPSTRSPSRLWLAAAPGLMVAVGVAFVAGGVWMIVHGLGLL